MKREILKKLNSVVGIKIDDFFVIETGEIIYTILVDRDVNQNLIAVRLAKVISEIQDEYRDYIQQEMTRSMPAESKFIS